jgi:hypothetical protein
VEFLRRLAILQVFSGQHWEFRAPPSLEGKLYAWIDEQLAEEYSDYGYNAFEYKFAIFTPEKKVWDIVVQADGHRGRTKTFDIKVNLLTGETHTANVTGA